ncbi:MAG TPA: hypothetical protein DCQ31_04505 [Bacteroidales bacterium]|nr:hypothetical protein [Bacteroidales bacterium]
MTINGEWYFPELNCSYFGTFIKENSTIKLNILAQLPSRKKTLRFPVVYGKTIDGDFTLLDCIWKGSYKYNNESEICESRLFCTSAIRGHCFKTSDDLIFNQFKFNFDGLKEWIGLQNLSTDFSYTNIKAEYENPKPIALEISNQIKGEIIFEFEDYTSENKDVIHQIKQYVYINLKSTQAIDYKTYINQKDILIHFFYFAINYKIKPYIQRFFNAEIMSNKNAKELVFIQNLHSEFNNFPDRHPFPCKYQDIANDFNAILANWFDKYDELKPIINIWFNFLSNAKLSVENKFILICQVLETFHARFYQQNETYIVGECNKRDNNPYFITRIKKLVEFARMNISEKFFTEYKDLLELANIVKETRNYYTHYDETKNKWTINDLLRYTPELINLLHILVLYELKINPKLLANFHNKQDFASYLDINDIPVFNIDNI